MLTIGWDVSTSITGIAALADGKLLWKEHIDLHKIDHLNDKLLAVRQHIRQWQFRSDCGATSMATHYIEDRLGNFSSGKTSMQTLMRLAAFNAMVAFVIEDELKIRANPIHPMTAKAQLRKMGLVIPKSKEMPKGEDKKTLTLAWVRARETGFSVDLNRNAKPKPWAYDEADAYCIALIGPKVLFAD